MHQEDITRVAVLAEEPGDLGAVAVAVDGNVGLARDRLRCPIWFIGSWNTVRVKVWTSVLVPDGGPCAGATSCFGIPSARAGVAG
jgi:hypothetical protein